MFAKLYFLGNLELVWLNLGVFEILKKEEKYKISLKRMFVNNYNEFYFSKLTKKVTRGSKKTLT